MVQHEPTWTPSNGTRNNTYPYLVQGATMENTTHEHDTELTDEQLDELSGGLEAVALRAGGCCCCRCCCCRCGCCCRGALAADVAINA